MDGGFTNRKAYELTNSQDLMDIKLKALQNLVEVKIKRISVGMIVIKNFNEGVIDDLLYLTNKYPTIKYLIGHHEYREYENSPLWLEKDDGYRTVKADPGDRFMNAVRAGVNE